MLTEGKYVSWPTITREGLIGGRAGKAPGTRAHLALGLSLAALAAPAGAVAQASAGAPPAFSPAEASVQLEQAIDAVTGAEPALDPTDELRHLAAALPSLEGRERRRARALLARPPAHNGAGFQDAGGFEPFGAEWSPAATASRRRYVSPGGGFIVHYVRVGGDAPDLADGGDPGAVPDYVEQVAVRADTSAAVENGTLGWPEPKSDGTRGGGNGLTDIYLADICGPRGCIFGYAGPDDRSPECMRPSSRCFAYLVLDNDYAPGEFGYPDPDIPLSVTVAHEYNHVLQFAIDTRQDGWMFESTATWAEEQVFPDADDWLFYLRVWKRTPQQPITKLGAGGGLRVYGSAVWNHWLELGAGYGPGVVLDSWQQSHVTDPRHFAVEAYDLGIELNGGRGFAQEFGRFTAATAEWQVLDGDFPDEGQLPDVRRTGTLRRAKRAKWRTLDHTGYGLFRVKPRRADTVTLRVRAPRGVRTAIALVGRDGPALAGTVTTSTSYSRRGGRDRVRLEGARGFERITAVVTNADGRIRRSGRYSRDNERFRASVR